MKSSQILASVLFGSLAAAVPFKRDLVTTTEVVIETVICYTTVWDDEPPVAEATTTAGGYFYEQPASSAEAETTPAAISSPAYTPPAVQEPSSVYTPPVQTPAPSSTVVVVSSAAPAPKPIETSSAPAAPTTTEAAYTPAPASSAPAASSAAAAPVAQEQSTGSTGSTSSTTGESFSGDLTINPLNGGLGACGKPLYPTDFVVALAAPAWGASTYDTQTGEATNPWCGKKIVIDYNGKKVDATIMDLCPGCKGHDIDLSDAAWAAIGMTEWTRVQGSWSLAE